MCGRYTVSNPGEILPELVGGGDSPEIAARFNVAPTQLAPVVIAGEDGVRRAVEMRWGLVPYWAEGPEIGSRMINARSETVAEKAAFRDSFRRRRCLVAADGFYEWQKVAGGKQPFLLRLTGGAPFGFAGLWDRWRGPRGRILESFTILTTTPNELVAPIHDRMPVILAPEGRDLWLDEAASGEALQGVLGPYAAAAMEAIAVSDYVSNPAHDSLRCMQPLLPPAQGTLF
ncbi:MAG: SOS response-associated peptidase [Acidobacteriota bacterium]|nr:SOS response-associated peptidase [Acidobacteriota bacterium]MDH3522149.1 SOS response-associated peptidase [Acidobacteriota bacterium]